MIRYFAGHPTAANLLLVLIVAAGILATPGLKRETFPRFAPTEIGIEVAYPGAASMPAATISTSSRLAAVGWPAK